METIKLTKDKLSEIADDIYDSIKVDWVILSNWEIIDTLMQSKDCNATDSELIEWYNKLWGVKDADQIIWCRDIEQNHIKDHIRYTLERYFWN